MGSPDFFLYAKHLSVSLEIPLKDFRGQGSHSGIKIDNWNPKCKTQYRKKIDNWNPKCKMQKDKKIDIWNRKCSELRIEIKMQKLRSTRRFGIGNYIQINANVMKLQLLVVMHVNCHYLRYEFFCISVGRNIH